MNGDGIDGPVLRGGLLALLAAALFGVSTPLVQALGRDVGPFSTAALLYLGAAVAAVALSKSPRQEARVQRADLGRLVVMALFGAVLGPVALAWGLQRTDGVSASLLLTLEAVFIALLAWRWYGETIDRRVGMAMAALVAGGVFLGLDQRSEGTTSVLGLLAVGVATLAWGIDSSLSRGVADRDPGQVVAIKSALGLLATSGLAWAVAEPPPSGVSAAGLLAVGATGYGLSLRCYLLAQRSFGAARTGSVFAFAPFLGAAVALALGERTPTPYLVVGGGLMVCGVLLHLAERHAHRHTHDAMGHEHAHRHDDGHHLHQHDPMPQGAHSHWHEHTAQTHNHPHVPDLHHTHRH